MFTGLVEGVGTIEGLTRMGEDIRLTISPHFDMADTKVGDSVSVDGVCLTVTGFKPGGFFADVSQETLTRSTMRRVKRGDKVNLERALRMIDRLGGHLVLGHVDGMGRILRKEQRQRSWLFRIGVDAGLSRYIVEKGSIAVDGVSLTVNKWDQNGFEVNIVPQTGLETTILKKGVGDFVNIETDLIGKYVERFLTGLKPTEEKKGLSVIDKDMLAEYGFGD
ncbi:MAG: riboflavin synthase [Deltaproteobacteria bacterium]|nr:riboflavin synthase [Deltaproteobacteria bacterium]